jgi:hypothetical protein
MSAAIATAAIQTHCGTDPVVVVPAPAPVLMPWMLIPMAPELESPDFADELAESPPPPVSEENPATSAYFFSRTKATTASPATQTIVGMPAMPLAAVGVA